MGISVYNTLSKQKEDFIPREPGIVRIYVCGLTPSGPTHVGHLRPPIVWDVIRKYLEYKGYEVFLVQNFTDVDDKIINRANSEGTSVTEVAKRYSREYLECLEAVYVRPADVYPKVSQHIADIVEVVRGLEEKGYAYRVDGDVFFSVTSFRDYGKLSGRSIEELKAGARIEIDERKRHPMDFALWKAAKEGEPAWDSPWGPGRPGWHIECSTMALKYLGSGFDFHGGGTDLIFPHHENEIAQAEAYTGKQPFVRYWLHNGSVNMTFEKMSKSVGNIVTAKEVLSRFSASAVRLYMLQSHYRTPIEFSWDRLEEASRSVSRLEGTVRRLKEAIHTYSTASVETKDTREYGFGSRPRAVGELTELTRTFKEAFEAAMDDDFNTALAIGSMFKYVGELNILLDSKEDLYANDLEVLKSAHDFLSLVGKGILGVLEDRKERARDGVTERLIELLLNLRQGARQQKDWQTADLIRAALKEVGVVVEDTPNGPRWYWST